MDVDENQIKAMIRGVDANSDGCVTIDEFINLMLQLRKRKQFLSSNSELHEAFLLCDLNKDGFLDKYDIYALFKDVGDHITMEMAAEMVDCVKSDSSGCISMSDFMRLALSRLTRL
ncbi:hypothetical protein BC833DRAFT_600146 [Globomyces pollinis-pini]|nr:hypothetical protein BC833DRAFT_600146 [Globomyces pollinis-pini]